MGLASFVGEAEFWYHKLKDHQPNINWEDFKQACILQFGSPQSFNGIGDLIELRQVGSLKNHNERFQRKLAGIGDSMMHDQEVKLFMTGLQKPTCCDVKILKTTQLGSCNQSDENL